jgi:hypothetical protein
MAILQDLPSPRLDLSAKTENHMGAWEWSEFKLLSPVPDVVDPNWGHPLPSG